jgi:hypothetical protein
MPYVSAIPPPKACPLQKQQRFFASNTSNPSIINTPVDPSKAGQGLGKSLDYERLTSEHAAVKQLLQ